MTQTPIPVLAGGKVPAGAPSAAERQKAISDAVNAAIRSVAENQAYLPSAKPQVAHGGGICQ